MYKFLNTKITTTIVINTKIISTKEYWGLREMRKRKGEREIEG